MLLNWNNALSFAGGAVAQLGLEGVRAGFDQQKLQLANDLAEHRDLANDTRREASAAAHDTRVFAHDESMQTGAFLNQSTLQAAGFANDKDLLAARQKFDSEQREADRKLTREQIASSEKQRGLDRQNAMAIAKLGGTIQTTPDGDVYMIGKDGKTQQIMDPNDPTKPLKTAKNLTPAAAKYADVLRDRMKAIENNQLMDPAEKDKRIAALDEELLVTVTRGVGSLGKSAVPAGAPPVGTVIGGNKFKGGDPNKRENWEPVTSTSSTKPAGSTSSDASSPPPEDDVLPEERGRRQEAAIVRASPPGGIGTKASLSDVRATLQKSAPNANDLLLLESFKDDPGLTQAERARITALTTRGLLNR